MQYNSKTVLVFTSLLMAGAILTSCTEGSITSGTSTNSDNSVVSSSETSLNTTSQISDDENSDSKFSKFDTNSDWDSSAVKIELNGDSATCDNANVLVETGKITIKSEGTYVVSGTISDGQIVITADKEQKVKLVLNNANINCSTTAPIYVKSADKTVITLADGTTNTLTDGANYVFEDENDKKPTGCIYSKDDLTINGNGTLNVNGNYNNGIACSNDLKLISGTINVTAINNGIKGNDSVSIMNGTITVTSADDGVKTDNETESDKGYFYMENGTLSIKASDDGICAISAITVTGGSITAAVGDKSTNCDGKVSIADGCLK